MAVQTPCLNQEEAHHKVIMDSIAIQNLQAQGHPVKDVSSWWSPTTMECHVIPIFRSDSWQDVCNRYFDHYPKEVKETVHAIADHKESLNKGGFSQDKTLMLMGSIPGGLRKALDIWHPAGDFWSEKKLRIAFFSYFPKFRIAQPFQASAVITKKVDYVEEVSREGEETSYSEREVSGDTPGSSDQPILPSQG